MNNEQIILGGVTLVTTLLMMGCQVDTAFTLAVFIMTIVLGFDGG